MCVSTTHWFSASHGTLVDIVTVILQFCLGEVNQFSMECVFYMLQYKVPNYDGQHMN